MAELGLNVFQVIQNELIAREGSRSTLGIGARLAILEERAQNTEAENRNSRLWKLNHALAPISAITPHAKEEADRKKKKLVTRKGAKPDDEKDPTMLVRTHERWEVHAAFPRTLLEFKELQFHPDKLRCLLEFYDVKVYTSTFKLVDLHRKDKCRDVTANIECCMEELAMTFGLNWQRIGGMNLPFPPTPVSMASGQWSARSLEGGFPSRPPSAAGNGMRTPPHGMPHAHAMMQHEFDGAIRQASGQSSPGRGTSVGPQPAPSNAVHQYPPPQPSAPATG